MQGSLTLSLDIHSSLSYAFSKSAFYLAFRIGRRHWNGEGLTFHPSLSRSQTCLTIKKEGTNMKSSNRRDKTHPNWDIFKAKGGIITNYTRIGLSWAQSSYKSNTNGKQGLLASPVLLLFHWLEAPPTLFLNCHESRWKPGGLHTRVVSFKAWSIDHLYQYHLRHLLKIQNLSWDHKIYIFKFEDQEGLEIAVNSEVLQLTCM